MKVVRLVATVAVAVGTLPLAGPAQAHESDVVFAGHGWGHGVGMSQYGAEAMAEDGFSSQEIVEYYFTGAEVKDLASAVSGWLVDDPSPLWVNIAGTPYTTPKSISLKETAGNLSLCQEEPAHVGSMSQTKNGSAYSPYVQLLQQRLATLGFDPGTSNGIFDEQTTIAVKTFQSTKGLVADGIVGPNTKNALWPPDSGDRCVVKTSLTTTAMKLTASSDGSECTLVGASTPPGSCVGSVRGLSPSKRISIPERKVRNGTAIELGHGSLRIRPDFDSSTSAFEGIHVVLEIGVNEYVYGIDEIIFSWPTAALEAQAIASRAYAVGTAKGKGPESGFSSTRKDSCWCHLWSNTYSQVYAGRYAETVAGAVWKSAANATAGEVLHHPTAGLVTAFFSSSNGGASESNEAAWGGAPVPYLRSVPDPWSLDTSGPFPNPFANWQYSFTPEEVAKRVGLDELKGASVVDANESGTARTVRFSGLVGGVEVVVDKTGASVRSLFGLRSNYYDVSWGTVASEPPGNPPAPSPNASFTDTAGHTFQDDIEWALENGVTRGCNPPENTRFCPNDAVSRGQMAAFLTRFLGLPSAGQDYFTDDNGSTFESDINRLAAAGITKGCGNGKFCPTAKVSREQMAAFLARAFDLTSMTHPGFSDVPASNTFASDINKLATAGITMGCNPPSNTRYCPTDNVTRGQMAAFLRRAATD